MVSAAEVDTLSRVRTECPTIHADGPIGLGFLRTVKRQDGGYVDFRGADIEVGAFRLELPIPKFTLDFHKGAFLQATGPAAQLRPHNTRVLLRPRPVFAGLLVLPTDVGRD